MKKLVPDPPVPYFLINAELSVEDALAQVDKLLDCLNGTIKANLSVSLLASTSTCWRS